MKKINIVKTAVCAFSLILLSSCDDERGYDDYGTEDMPSQALNGEWYIDVIDEATGTVYVQHALHRTYDDNNGRMWISDKIGENSDGTPILSGWWLIAKADYNVENLTFSTTNEPNEADGSVVTITEGKILKDAATSLDGNVTDSIYFKGVFDYDPESTIIFAGHRVTGFEEDVP
ncbi:MAG TPA: lipid-binding protein [Flavobacterium sp.]|nr:lipid-binding protein [Flavobacterium sp.]